MWVENSLPGCQHGMFHMKKVDWRKLPRARQLELPAEFLNEVVRDVGSRLPPTIFWKIVTGMHRRDSAWEMKDVGKEGGHEAPKRSYTCGLKGSYFYCNPH